jgi:alkylation response protein AidB-like acyl-CoA dehydrogenase
MFFRSSASIKPFASFGNNFPIKPTGASLRTFSSQTKEYPFQALVDTPEEAEFRTMVSKFAEQKIAPLVREMDQKSKMDTSVINGMFENGFMGIEIPEQYGGTGASFTSSIIVIEELAKVDPSVSVCCDVQNTLVDTLVMKYGNENQKQKYLPKLAKDTIGSFCLSEWESGSDAFALKARAEDKGDHYVLNGTKAWITNSAEAGIFIVMANVDPSKGYKGITSFVIEKSNPGIKIGKKEDVGNKSFQHLRSDFDRLQSAKIRYFGTSWRRL